MTMDDFALTLTNELEADTEAVIEEGLAKYNEDTVAYSDARALVVEISDPASQAVVGGLLGRTSLGLFFIDLFFLPDSVRGHGIGTRIMEKAEEEARRRGCCVAVVYTITFQAPGFISAAAIKCWVGLKLNRPVTRGFA